MATHTRHPDSHTHGLADGCPRCDQHAAHPLLSLDNQNIKAINERVLQNLPPRSENERKAMVYMVRAKIEAEKLLAAMFDEVKWRDVRIRPG